jgi:hypothetical protein
MLWARDGSAAAARKVAGRFASFADSRTSGSRSKFPTILAYVFRQLVSGSPCSYRPAIARGRRIRLIERIGPTCAADATDCRKALIKAHEAAILGAPHAAT